MYQQQHERISTLSTLLDREILITNALVQHEVCSMVYAFIYERRMKISVCI